MQPMTSWKENDYVEKLIELLAMSYGIDALLADNDINPELVVEWLIEEGHLDLSDYEEDTDEQ